MAGQAILRHIDSKALSDYYHKAGPTYGGPPEGRRRAEELVRAISHSALQGLVGRYTQDFSKFGFTMPAGLKLPVRT